MTKNGTVILTAKQQEILKLRYEGLSLNEIGRKLGKSPQAVFGLVKTLRRKGFEV